MYVNYCYICSFENDVFNKWAGGVDIVAKASLEKPLLVWEKKEEADLLKVNFDPQVKLHF